MISKVFEAKYLENLHRFAFENCNSFATYSLPDSKEVVSMLQCNSEPIELRSVVDLEGRLGFVFAPFDMQSKHPIRLIEPDHIFKSDEDINHFLNSSRVAKTSLVSKDIDHGTSYYEVNTQEYIAQVEQIQEFINMGKLNKLVLSRLNIDEKPTGFNPTLFFDELQKKYTKAFVFMVYIHRVGLWLGASPEPLLQINNSIVQTVSLAGTKMFSNGHNQSNWGEKELEEQDIVTKYIEESISKFSISNFEKEGPNTLRAGSVEHLITRFSFKLDDLSGSIFSFLNTLHPTPSVCGLPKEQAFSALKLIEKHDREYYTGFLGPLSIDNELNLFVNLRCMKVLHDGLVYFLGAGITSGSNPQGEWDETLNKKKTLTNIFESLNLK